MAGETDKRTNNSPDRPSRWPDRRIAALADRQHRVVAASQLKRIGLSRGQIKYRLRSGRLSKALPGTYVVAGGRLTFEGRLMAAAQWAGPGAVASHRSAAALWGLLPPRAPIHVTSPSQRKPRAGHRPHQRLLPADETAVHAGVPVTTVARTLLDVAAMEGRDTFLRALREAEYRGLADATPLERLIARYPGGRGTGIAAAALAGGGPGGHTESELEDRFLELLLAHGLPLPRANAWLALGGRRIRVDCLWEAERTVVELDGRRAHMTAERFESDRSRDMALTGLGYAVARVTWRRLHEEPAALARELGALLTARR